VKGKKKEKKDLLTVGREQKEQGKEEVESARLSKSRLPKGLSTRKKLSKEKKREIRKNPVGNAYHF